jgi:hypothetical protein
LLVEPLPDPSQQKLESSFGKYEPWSQEVNPATPVASFCKALPDAIKSSDRKNNARGFSEATSVSATRPRLKYTSPAWRSSVVDSMLAGMISNRPIDPHA